MNRVPIPQADANLGRKVWQTFRREFSPLDALRLMRDNLGDIFQVNLPGFSPVFLCGPKYSRFVLVDGRDYFLWRTESDPVTKLLRHGLLVEDGDFHAQSRLLNAPFYFLKEMTISPNPWLWQLPGSGY